jgi:hypothetical protein
MMGQQQYQGIVQFEQSGSSAYCCQQQHQQLVMGYARDCRTTGLENEGASSVDDEHVHDFFQNELQEIEKKT